MTLAPDTRSIGAARRLTVLPLLRSPWSVVSLTWFGLLLLACLLAPVLPLPDPLGQDLNAGLMLPSSEHWLGTDSLGRDVLARILFGGQSALLGAALATLIALLVGGIIGLLAGWRGGWVDAAASRLAELIFSMPAIVILLAVAAILGRDIAVSMTVFGLLASAAYVRLAQASTRAVRQELFIDAARVSGLPKRRIVFGEVLPNIVGPLVVQSSLTFGTALLVMASLGFLGLGPTPPAPDWGAMIAEASQQIYSFPWLLFPSGVVLALTILAVNLIGDAIRDGDTSRRRPSMLTRARVKRPSSTSQVRVERASVVPDGLLEIVDLEVTFPGSDGVVPVVRGVGFALQRGEILGLVGESGSGKTMTALAILGLVPAPGRVTSGHIRFADRDLAHAPESVYRRFRGKRIAMISQEPMVALDPSFTVRSQIVPAIRRFHNVSKGEAITRARSLLSDVGLPQPERVLRSFPFQLSGGMAQRVAVAMALAGDPDVLIADEPTTALDVTVQAGILDLLRSLRAERGMSILLVTHDLGVVADICDRVIVMERARIVEQAPVDELFLSPQHPYTQRLIASTPSLVEVARVDR